MKYIEQLREGERISDVYLCKFKQSAVTKNGKAYENIILQDKTGTVDAKIWDPNSAGIGDFDQMDYIYVHGEVSNFQGTLQVSIKRVSKASEGDFDPADYLPVSKYNIEDMYKELLSYIAGIENQYLRGVAEGLFIKDQDFAKAFQKSSAAKAVHHGFVGGLLEHTLGVVRLCDYYAKAYPMLNRDLLLTAAMCHDIGKVKELSLFPENNYTDEGQLLGHIIMGSEMVGEKAREIVGFPDAILFELKHCILAHHGELEYGSPKKPALMEAVALFFADNTDAKLEIMTEVFSATTENGWLGYNRLFESNIRRTVL